MTSTSAQNLEKAVDAEYARHAHRHNASSPNPIPLQRPRGRSPARSTDASTVQLVKGAPLYSMYALHGKKSRKLPLSDDSKIKIGRACIARTVPRDKRGGYRCKVFAPGLVKFGSTFQGIAWIGDVAICVENKGFGIRLALGHKTRLVVCEWTSPTGTMHSNTFQISSWSSRNHLIPGTLENVRISSGVVPALSEKSRCSVTEHACLAQAAAEVTQPGRQMIYVKPAHYGKYFIATVDARNRMHCCTCKFYIGTERKTRSFNQHFGLEQRWQNLEWVPYTENKSKCDCTSCSRTRALQQLVGTAQGGHHCPEVVSTLLTLANQSTSASAFAETVNQHVWQRKTQNGLPTPHSKHPTCGLMHFGFSNAFLVAAYRLATQ